MIKPLSIFVSYAHQDKLLLEELVKFLKHYEKNQIISIWTDQKILEGKWDEKIISKLKTADVMLLLVSINSINSTYINETEIKSATADYKIVFIPILIRAVPKNQLGYLSDYQMLPPGALAVTDWNSMDKAWVEITTVLEKIFDQLNGKQYLSSENEDIIKVQSGNTRVLNKVNYTDKIEKGSLILLLFLSLYSLGVGLKADNDIYFFCAFIGLGICFFSYFFSRRNLSL